MSEKAYFPLFISLQGRPCLIVGGGAVALRKARALLPCGPVLRAVAPAFAPGWEALAQTELLRRPFCPEDLAGQTLVIAATHDRAENSRVAALCRAARIPVNAVDAPEDCSFFFPALVRRGTLSVGISTGGASPTAAACVRRRVEAVLPEREAWEEILADLAARRAAVRAAVPQERARAALYAQMFEACMTKNRPLTQAEFEALLRAALA